MNAGHRAGDRSLCRISLGREVTGYPGHTAGPKPKQRPRRDHSPCGYPEQGKCWQLTLYVIKAFPVTNTYHPEEEHPVTDVICKGQIP
jgi:hypothetical protein